MRGGRPRKPEEAETSGRTWTSWVERMGKPMCGGWRGLGGLLCGERWGVLRWAFSLLGEGKVWSGSSGRESMRLREVRTSIFGGAGMGMAGGVW